jgi:hypothetical protein
MSQKPKKKGAMSIGAERGSIDNKKVTSDI